MKRLAENLFQHVIPINEGYDYLFSDVVYIPVYDTSLLITKRIVMPISLVEEKILQLLDIGILQFDEISNILGLSRRLLEVTLADLYSKDLVAVSSGECRIMSAGRNALLNLNRAEKKQDILKNVFLDGILGQIIDSSDYDFQTGVRTDDNKLKPTILPGDVSYYTNKFKEISELFNEENKIFFSEGVQPIKEELLKIDKVDSTFVKYIKILVNVYVSSNGIDIDVTVGNNKLDKLFKKYKDYIIEQINNKKVFKNHFKYRRLTLQKYRGEDLEKCEELIEELKKLHFTRKRNKSDYERIEKIILSSRKLEDGENSDILKYLSTEQANIELYVHNLDDCAYDSNFLCTLYDVLGKATLSVFYNESRDAEKAIKQFKRNFNRVQGFTKDDNKFFVCWKVGGFKIYGIPTLRNVINEDTVCLVISYYLEISV